MILVTLLDFYDVIIVLIPAWLLALMGAATALGWLWRLHRHVPYIPPKAYKISSMIGWGLAAIFYTLIALGTIDGDQAVAMVRFVWLILFTNEIVAHLYVYWICRHLETQPTS